MANEYTNENKFDFVIIGGGIAGTICAQKLSAISTLDVKILIVSASPLVKAVTNFKSVTKFLNTFDIEEKQSENFAKEFKNLTIVNKVVVDLESDQHKIICSDETRYSYGKLCICTGASPKLISGCEDFILGIRDTETISTFQSRLANARQIVLIGNGGIATELAYEIENCKLIWAIKDDNISNVYFDAHASKFFEKKINQDKATEEYQIPAKRSKYTISRYDMSQIENQAGSYGSALGPDWSLNLTMKGKNKEKSHDIVIESKCEIKRIIKRDEYFNDIKKNKQDFNSDIEQWPIYVEFSNNKVYGCDFVVSATGVLPAVEVFTKNNKFDIGFDGGLKVNERMETSIESIYACGDACTAGWKPSPHWFQMRLWNQACQMGDYAARSMWSSYLSEPIELDFCFELFAHITKFFNYKVILLGKYDARDLGNDYQLLLRWTEGEEYVKLVLHNNRVYGALLIGETDLEETFENLIVNQIDVSQYGEDLLNPDIDIEDYFD